MSHHGSPCQTPVAPSLRAEPAKLSEQRSEGQRLKKAPWTHSRVSFYVGECAPGTGCVASVLPWRGQLDIYTCRWKSGLTVRLASPVREGEHPRASSSGCETISYKGCASPFPQNRGPAHSQEPGLPFLQLLPGKPLLQSFISQSLQYIPRRLCGIPGH